MEPELENVINFLKENGGIKKILEIPQRQNLENWEAIKLRIMHSGYAIFRPDDGTLVLTEKGWEFESFRTVLEEKKMQKELIDASIKTNNSVLNLNQKTDVNIDTQKRLTYVALIVAGASALFSLASVIATYRDTSSTHLKNIQSELQLIWKKEDSLRQAIETLQTKDILKNADTLKVVQVK